MEPVSDGYVDFEHDDSLINLVCGDVVLLSHITDFRGGIDYLKNARSIESDAAQLMNTISRDIFFQIGRHSSAALHRALAQLLREGADLLRRDDAAFAHHEKIIRERAERIGVIPFPHEVP